MKTYWTLWIFFVAWSAGSEPDLIQEVEQSPTTVHRIKKLKVKEVSDLNKLSPFEDISVIQRRYLPKTNRFELGFFLEAMLNNYFYHLGGVGGHLEFFVREKHGLGATGHYLFRTKKPVSIQLDQPPNRIRSYNLFTSRSYAGLYYKWSPVYGKFSVLNKKIVYFDMFFTLGGGATQIEKGLTQRDIEEIQGAETLNVNLARDWFPTGAFSFGQVFALSKDLGIHWSLKWHYYRYQLSRDSQFRNHHDLSFALGLNYYFPGAQYR